MLLYSLKDLPDAHDTLVVNVLVKHYRVAFDMTSELKFPNPDILPIGQFTKFTIIRIQTINAESNDYISAVNGTLAGDEANFGILLCDFNKQLNDYPVAFYQQGSVKWFANISNAAPIILQELKNKLSLSKPEKAAVKGLIMDEDYAEIIPGHWEWRFGSDFSGEIKYDDRISLVGKLAINTAVYWDHRVSIENQDLFGVNLDDGSGNETPDDDCELVAIG
jgi:hypothetical protein